MAGNFATKIEFEICKSSSDHIDREESVPVYVDINITLPTCGTTKMIWLLFG